MPRFDIYRTPEAAPARPRSHSIVWAALCISLEISVLFWLWVVLNP
jgi:hypothetical protein